MVHAGGSIVRLGPGDQLAALRERSAAIEIVEGKVKVERVLQRQGLARREESVGSVATFHFTGEVCAGTRADTVEATKDAAGAALSAGLRGAELGAGVVERPLAIIGGAHLETILEGIIEDLANPERGAHHVGVQGVVLRCRNHGVGGRAGGVAAPRATMRLRMRKW